MTSLKNKSSVRLPLKKDIEALSNLFNHGLLNDAAVFAGSLTTQYPNHGFAWKVLGAIYQEQKRFEESLVATRKALVSLPADAAIHNNLGTALLGLGRTAEAEVSFRKALLIAPGYTKALNNLGTLLRQQGKLAEAETHFRNALESDPQDALGHIRLGNTLELQNKLHQAHQSYRRALHIQPDMQSIHSDLLHLMSLDAKTTPEQLFAEHTAFGAQLETNEPAALPHHGNSKELARCLKIGFVTADLYDHALANYLEPLFAHLSEKDGLSLHVYYNNTNEDVVTRRMRDYLSNWNAVSLLSDDDLVSKIRNDDIDILVDLNGHTVLNRLQVFARKPAPVQVSWLGYLGTTGLRSMDYYVADSFWIPPGKLDWQFSERLAYLPAVVAFEPNHLSPPINALPALTNGHITFGSFNRQNKINAAVVALWAELMRSVPGSKMVLGAIPSEHQDNLIGMFESEGIDRQHLRFFGRAVQTEYLALHHHADFCLDTFPFGGGATTAHAAWMGVPTLCLTGATPASRFGATELHHLGLDDFIATNAKEFIEKGIFWAHNIAALSHIREGMRTRFGNSPLAQYAEFADNFEVMLRTMWQRWCNGLPPAALNIEPIGPKVSPREPKDSLSPPACDMRALRRLYEQHKYEETEALATELIRKFPTHGLARKLLGSALHKLGRSAESLVVHKATVEARPDDYEAHFNLASQCQQLGLLDDSVRSYVDAIGLRPNDPSAYNNLGNIFKTMGLFPQAEMYCRQAIALAPAMAHAHNNLANALHAQGKYTESLASYRQALVLKPEWAEAYNNLAITLKDQGHGSEAKDAYRKALKLKPNWAAAQSNLLYCMSLDLHTSPEQLYAEHMAFGQCYEPPLLAERQEHSNTKHASRALHIGFVSGDLYDHALTNFLEPVFAALANRVGLVLHAYYTHIYDDAATERMRSSFAHWNAVAGLSDVDLANRIRADGIDILFDLAGHTAHNRLLAFARKPAPIQVSWLGYLGTTGMKSMDYYLCDRFWVPPGELDWQFSEKPAYLPAAVVFQPSPLSPEVNALPALKNGHITFGSFNRTNKLNPAVVVLWSMLLHKVPDAHMVFGGIPAESQIELFHKFSDEGIEPHRLTFFPRSNLQEYLALHHQVDFCLDTFPYGGGATTAHAAWMGVPSLSLAGESPASRFGASAMHQLGLDGFIATSIDDYLVKGCYWAEHTTELAAIRLGMRERFQQSTLGQHALFADNLHTMLRTMWQRWCDDSPPEMIMLDSQQTAPPVSTPPEHTTPSEQELATLSNLYEQGQYPEASALARLLTEHHPQHGFAWGILAYVCIAQERYEDAVPPLARYIDIHPDEPSTYVNLGVALAALNRLPEAEIALRKALDIAPHHGGAEVHLGIVLRLQGQLLEAEDCCRRALEIDRCDANAHVQLGKALEEQGKLSEAQASYYRADMAHEPRRAVAHSNVLYLLSHDVLVEPRHLFAEHVAFGEQFEAPLRQEWNGHSNINDPTRTLKVGFVSGDFCHHALNEFLEPAFKALGAHKNLTLCAYSTGTQEDAVTLRMRQYFAHWSTVTSLSDPELAHLIRTDAIDILIDLSGHTAKNRLLTFARKPAPVQMSWLGYLGTTGLAGMDYYLCDSTWILPNQSEWQFTERMAYLPNAVVFQPDPLAPPVNTLPALRNGYVTFGSFNRVTKINESVIALWSMLLQKAPTAKLLLVGIEAANQSAITETFVQQGIETHRLSFRPRVATAQYLALHHEVDFCLDTFPHGGGATTAHAAWMGVPTLCLAGEAPASRFSASLMLHLGHGDFVTRSIDEFIERGLEWTNSLATLAQMRASMRQHFAASPLGQPERFAHSMEAVLRDAWKTWCHSAVAPSINPCQSPPSVAEKDLNEVRTLTQALIRLAQDNESSGDQAAAACLYGEALKLNPESAYINYRLGLLEATLKGVTEALPRFEAAIQFEPDLECHWVAYIEALIQTGALETAVSALEWGQKYGLSEPMAEKIAGSCVAALEKKLNPPPAEVISPYSEEELGWPAAPAWPETLPSVTADLSYIRAPASAHRRYVIFAPFYRHNSAGIRVMYDLQKWLILAGQDAIVIAGVTSYATEQFAEDIVIYPEVVTGNPLKAKRVVRYILNVPGKLGGTKHYAAHELLVAYSEPLAAHAAGRILNLPTIEPFFCKVDGPKPKLAVYIGKGADLKLHPEECIYITRDFPSSRRGVAMLLQQVSTLYTYDDFTAIELEALLCGCEVKVIQKNGEVTDLQYSFLDSQITPIQNVKAQLHDFIEMTKLL